MSTPAPIRLSASTSRAAPVPPAKAQEPKLGLLIVGLMILVLALATIEWDVEGSHPASTADLQLAAQLARSDPEKLTALQTLLRKNAHPTKQELLTSWVFNPTEGFVFTSPSDAVNFARSRAAVLAIKPVSISSAPAMISRASAPAMP